MIMMFEKVIGVKEESFKIQVMQEYKELSSQNKLGTSINHKLH